MKLIDTPLLDATTARAKQSPRLRMNHNFHERLDDPVNRLLNALEPGTYLRPHRHSNPDKTEIFLLLRGRVSRPRRGRSGTNVHGAAAPDASLIAKDLHLAMPAVEMQP